ncbi:MAG: hypothetical protein ACK556_18330, partial [Pseudanabaena sp.]
SVLHLLEKRYINAIFTLLSTVVLQSNFFSNCIAGVSRPQYNYIALLPSALHSKDCFAIFLVFYWDYIKPQQAVVNELFFRD